MDTRRPIEVLIAAVADSVNNPCAAPPLAAIQSKSARANSPVCSTLSSARSAVALRWVLTIVCSC